MIFLKILKWLFVALAFAFPFGIFLKAPIEFIWLPEVKLYLTDILVFLIGFSWLGWHFFTRKRVCYPAALKNLFGFLGILSVSFLINIPKFKPWELTVGFLYLVRYLVYSFLFLVVFDLVGNLKNFQKFFQNCFFLWGVILSVLGICQYIFFPDIRSVSSLGWDLHYYRVVGPFLDPNFMGCLLSLAAVYFLALSRWPFLILTFISLLFTYSRGSYLSFFLGSFTVFTLKKREKIIFITIIIFIISMILLPRPGGEGVKLERVVSFFQRVENWQTAIKIWERYPLLGVGFNNYRYAQRKFGFLSSADWKFSHAGAGVDNSFLFILVTSGLIGEILFISFWLKIVSQAMRIKVFVDRLIVLASLATIFTHCLFINSLFFPWVMIWIWVLLGVKIRE